LTISPREQLPDLRAIVMWGEDPWQEGVISWQQLLAIGHTGSPDSRKDPWQEEVLSWQQLLAIGHTGSPDPRRIRGRRGHLLAAASGYRTHR
jgi:hypothetical protein